MLPLMGTPSWGLILIIINKCNSYILFCKLVEIVITLPDGVKFEA